MRKILLLSLLYCMLATAGCAHFGFSFDMTLPLGPMPEERERARRVEEEPTEEAVIRARDRVYPALVNISVISESFSGGARNPVVGTGSGTIVSPDGYVLTNHHVAGYGVRILCTLSSKEEVPARLVGTDPLTDLAVIQLDLSARKDRSPLPVARLGDSDQLQVGDTVLAMGSPRGLSRSVTLGIVSNTERTLGGAFQLDDGELTGVLTQWIQHDALIAPGNSGGPLVNLNGEVIGVNELGGTGFGFAIPSNLSREVMNELIRHGRVRRSWSGIQVQTLLKGGEEKEGILVSSVIPDSPASEADIRPGDILLTLDGEPIRGTFEEEIPVFYRRVARLPIGSTVKLTCKRGGETHTAQMTTREMEKPRGEERDFKFLGITVQEITGAAARERKLNDARGVIVTGVQLGEAAGTARPPIQSGDILRKINGSDIPTLDALEQWAGAQPEEERREVLALVERWGEEIATVMTVGYKDPSRSMQVPKAWLGCDTQVLTRPIAQAMGLEEIKGVRVTRVPEGTPAAEAGLVPGDIITRIGEQAVPAYLDSHQEMFETMVRRMPIGAKTELSVLRGGEGEKLSVTLGTSPVQPKDADRYKNRLFEIEVREITFRDRVNRKWSGDVRGILVEEAKFSGWAGFAGLRPGDLIVAVDGNPVESTGDLEKILEKIEADKPDRTVFRILRGIYTYFLEIEPQWN